MKLNFGKQVKFEELSHLDFDIFIMAFSHEERFKTLNDRKELKFRKRIVLSYKNQNLFVDQENTKTYQVESENYVETMINMLDVEIKLLSTKNYINILVDYSSMTKSWYYTIMSYFTLKELHFENVNIYFSYTPSIFSEPLDPKHNSFIDPIPGRFNIPSLDKPKALIVGLGYENKKAEGIIEYLDPKITYALYSSPALDDRFSNAVELSNKKLISDLQDKVIKFPFDDLFSIERVLTSLYFSLRDDYNVIIAPLGPKPFTFIAMLLSIKYDDIDVWRVSSGSDFNKYSRLPLEDTFIICEVVFSKS
jgi:hypothetical protein